MSISRPNLLLCSFNVFNIFCSPLCLKDTRDRSSRQIATAHCTTKNTTCPTKFHIQNPSSSTRVEFVRLSKQNPTDGTDYTEEGSMKFIILAPGKDFLKHKFGPCRCRTLNGLQRSHHLCSALLFTKEYYVSPSLGLIFQGISHDLAGKYRNCSSCRGHKMHGVPSFF